MKSAQIKILARILKIWFTQTRWCPELGVNAPQNEIVFTYYYYCRRPLEDGFLRSGYFRLMRLKNACRDCISNVPMACVAYNPINGFIYLFSRISVCFASVSTARSVGTAPCRIGEIIDRRNAKRETFL